MKLPIQEINISLIVNDLTPAMLNLNSLRQAGVTNIQKLLENQIKDWQNRELISRDRSRVLIQSNKIIFSEPISSKNKIQNLKIAEKVISYINNFPQIHYQQISIDFNSYIHFDSQQKLAEFLNQSIIAANPWQNLASDMPITLSLQLSFPYEDGIFNVSVERTNIYEQNQNSYIIWFTGKFDYALKDTSDLHKLKAIEQKVKKYRVYASQFQKFVANHFAL